MSELAEIIYHNQQPFLKLPTFFQLNSKPVYLRQDPETGDMIVSQTASDWDDVLKELQALGELEELPDWQSPEREIYRNPLADWED